MSWLKQNPRATLHFSILFKPKKTEWFSIPIIFGLVLFLTRNKNPSFLTELDLIS